VSATWQDNFDPYSKPRSSPNRRRLRRFISLSSKSFSNIPVHENSGWPTRRLFSFRPRPTEFGTADDGILPFIFITNLSSNYINIPPPFVDYVLLQQESSNYVDIFPYQDHSNPISGENRRQGSPSDPRSSSSGSSSSSIHVHDGAGKAERTTKERVSSEAD